MSAFATKICPANVCLIEDGKTQEVEEYLDENYVVNFGGSIKIGHGGVREFTKAIRSAFSGLSVDVKILVESGNRISWQRSVCWPMRKGRSMGSLN